MAIDGISAALQGLQTQRGRINDAAENIARYPGQKQSDPAQELEGGPVKAPEGTPFGKEISLDEEIVTLVSASNLYKANAAVIKTLQETEDSVLDILS